MWTRRDLKTRAKAVLKLSYWKAFLVSLVIAIAGGSSGNSFNFNWNTGSSDIHSATSSLSGLGDALPVLVIAAIIAAIGFIFLLFLAFRIFIGYPLEVGGRKYFIESQSQIFDMNRLGCAFNKARYFDIIKSMLWRAFINFLWYLLLIIPGIVKSYSYRMVPYILADNPNIGYRRALDLSNQMTRGHKFRIFVLDLSFIGWFLLGFLALLIGVLFVLPYFNATNAELYVFLRSTALENGVCSKEELLLE